MKEVEEGFYSTYVAVIDTQKIVRNIENDRLKELQLKTVNKFGHIRNLNLHVSRLLQFADIYNVIYSLRA